MKLIDGAKRYCKGNIHTHTTVSDGVKTPEEVKRLYKDAGYDFLVLTDHWLVQPCEMFEGMLVLSGAEYDFTFPKQVLHVLGIFPDDRAAKDIARGMGHEELIAGINLAGGAAVAAHPAWSLNTPEFLASLDGVCGAEVYNTLSGTPWSAPRADAGTILDLVLTGGRMMNLFAADDSHYYTGEQLVSYIKLAAEELTPEGIISAMKRGDFYASQGPEFIDVELTEKELIVRSSPVSRCTFISDLNWVKGRCRSGENMTEFVYELQKDRGEGYVRCEITDADGRRAWLNPVRL